MGAWELIGKPKEHSGRTALFSLAEISRYPLFGTIKHLAMPLYDFDIIPFRHSQGKPEFRAGKTVGSGAPEKYNTNLRKAFRNWGMFV